VTRIPIDAALRRLLDEQATASAALGSFASMTDSERVQLRRALIQRALASRASIRGLPNDVESRELMLDDAHAQLPARVYRPAGEVRPPALLLYLHGGGWVAGSIETHDPFCRLLCAAARVAVLSVEYRLAPEYHYPAALEDVGRALRAATRTASQWGVDATRLGLGGDSSGANLAAVTAHQMCATGEMALRALLLLYPVTDHPRHEHRSYSENATGYGLEASLMRWFWDQYAPGVSPDDPNASPLRLKNLPQLPPTLISTAEYDVLRDEGVEYAHKLRAAGVELTHLHAPDMHHNFPVHPGTVARFPQCEAALEQISVWLKRTLGTAAEG
jgi:acetyl esterase